MYVRRLTYQPLQLALDRFANFGGAHLFHACLHDVAGAEAVLEPWRQLNQG